METLEDITLEQFLEYYLKNRPIVTPPEEGVTRDGTASVSTLYRHGPFQVQFIMIDPMSEVIPHIHPNMDSFEVYVSGDIDFMKNGEWFPTQQTGDVIYVGHEDWHGGKFKERGGSFLSVQKWINGVAPKTVVADWADTEGNPRGGAIPMEKE